MSRCCWMPRKTCQVLARPRPAKSGPVAPNLPPARGTAREVLLSVPAAPPASSRLGFREGTLRLHSRVGSGGDLFRANRRTGSKLEDRLRVCFGVYSHQAVMIECRLDNWIDSLAYPGLMYTWMPLGCVSRSTSA